ncbi:PLP-dependent aminotransferase family protein [Bosea sp. (in: a-proteobacteria)]|uniref:MocR-like pyridoxine biosynthesis transcription factor PdxR n=1 Tax=Bosea sp. (in: a-proteobacteria) TaxID=1871050 RepID=UPI001AC39D09|nr:PLP-dependent aminotransferase family protein [Bosea sp. (in: a-proteobacteria)]MBN9437979.1 PLP-dependent aminotransferase family protein [Bosea sp. (in: a-proteobacteria)]
MGKGTTLAVEVRPEGREPIFLALARAIIEEIDRGRLKPGSPLPGTRALARALQLNRNTVDAAYHELTMQGWLATEPSRGTFVATDLPDGIRASPPVRRVPVPEPAAPRPAGRPMLKLSDGYPDVRLLPTTAFAQAFRRALMSHAFASGGSYGDPRGSGMLREALSAYLRDERGLASSADDILVARGSQMALFLAASAVAEPGTAIAVERPGYPLAWSAFRAAGISVIGVPVDGGGIDVEALERLANGNRNLRAVYVTPHHQYPTTVTLGAARRLRLLEIARQYSLVVIEDDYDNEYRFDGRPILPLAARASDELPIIYLGSLSKLLAPGIRVGYAVAPPKLLRPMADRRVSLDRQGDLALENALADLLADGTIKRHARKARRIYHGRRDHLAGLLAERFSQVAEFSLPAGGLAIWLRLLGGISAETWATNAARLGLSVLPGLNFELETARPPEAFRLGFASLDEREQMRAIDILARSMP